jgi:hypothetical protein
VPFDRPGAQEGYLDQAAAALKQKFDFNSNSLEISTHATRVSARLYFSLNRAYKIFRMKADHNTKPAKIAGLTAASIMLVRPVHSPLNLESNELYYSNPFFAIMCGAAIVGRSKELDEVPTDTLMRVAGWMDQLRVENSQDLVKRISTCLWANEFLPLEEAVLTLSPREVIQLDMFVSFFELI